MKNEEEKKEDENMRQEDGIMYAAQPVEYYVNYLNHARRMDRWVQENMVRIDDEKVEGLYEEHKKEEARIAEEKKNETFLANDEHNAMSEQDLANFINITKLKTIEFL